MAIRYVSLAALCALPAVATAQEQRQLDAHEHGVSTVEIALEEATLTIDLYAPGMDIVGFEYEAESATDRDAVAEAVRQLSRAEEIVALPDGAGCRLSEVLSHLHSGEGEHDETHAHAEGEDHGDEGHADGEDHGDEEHAEEGSQHSEFHARYAFTCDDPDALTQIGFPFFEAFANAEEIEAQYVTAAGAGTAEIGRDAASVTFD